MSTHPTGKSGSLPTSLMFKVTRAPHRALAGQVHDRACSPQIVPTLSLNPISPMDPGKYVTQNPTRLFLASGIVWFNGFEYRLSFSSDTKVPKKFSFVLGNRTNGQGGTPNPPPLIFKNGDHPPASMNRRIPPYPKKKIIPPGPLFCRSST